jgi:DNA-directed RNA polymerase subunit L
MVVVTEYAKTNEQLVFQFEDCDVSVVNALRRVILTQIKSVVFRGFPHEKNKIDILKNNTKFNNEYIKHRISCIPIMYNKTDKFNTLINKYYIKVHLKNETSEKMILTTDHFKLLKKKDDSKAELSEPLFDQLPIPIIYLYPQISSSDPFEEFEAHIDLSIGCAKEDSCWNMVSKCLYYQVENEEKVQKQIDEIEKEDLGEQEKKVKIEDFKLLDAQKPKYCYDNKYHFVLETIGVYDNPTLLKMACDYLIEQFKQLISDTNESIYNTNLLIKENETTLIFINEEKINNHIKYRIQLQKDDYTLGKLIEKYAYNYFNSNNGVIEKLFKIVSFKKEHPHDEHCVIYMIYENNVDSDLFKHLKMIYNIIIEDFNNIKENIK